MTLKVVIKKETLRDWKGLRHTAHSSLWQWPYSHVNAQEKLEKASNELLTALAKGDGFGFLAGAHRCALLAVRGAPRAALALPWLSIWDAVRGALAQGWWEELECPYAAAGLPDPLRVTRVAPVASPVAAVEEPAPVVVPTPAAKSGPTPRLLVVSPGDGLFDRLALLYALGDELGRELLLAAGYSVAGYSVAGARRAGGP